MVLSEVVFKIQNSSFGPCEYTQRNPDVKAILNQTSWDSRAGQAKAIITILGPEEKVAELARLFESLHDSAETLQTDKAMVVLHVSTSVETLRKTGNPRAFALEYFNDHAIFAPSLLRDGYWHTRLIVANKVDIAAMLAEYEKGVQTSRWTDFKLIRIENFDPDQQVQGPFAENLTPKQMEVIKTALALGFYNTPRDVTLDDLSNIFGISKAAVHNRLQAAERKVIAKFFG
ncbi:MAG: helix-turn-helix domain-containing protein [Thermoplasmatota archaeon]